MSRPGMAATVRRIAPFQVLYRGLTALLPLLLAAWFGRSAATDLYTLFATLFTLAGSLVFSSFQDSALVPIVADVQRREPAQLPRFAGALYAYSLVIASALALVMGSAVWLWFRARVSGGTAVLVVPMTIGFSLYLPLIALRSLSAALLAARFRFLPDALAGATGVLVTLAIAALARGRGLALIPFALAAGELVAATWLIIALRRSGLPISPGLLTFQRPPALMRFVRLVSSEIGGSAVSRVNPLIDQMMARALGIVGGGTMLRLTGDLASFPTSLLGSTFLSVLLSHLAAAGADGRRYELRRTVVRSMLVISALLAVVALALFALRIPLVTWLYGRGAMDPAALARMARLLPYHLVGLVPFGVALVLVRAHISLGNSRILVSMGAISAAANLALNLIFVRVLGLEGIALATSAVNVLIAGVFWIRFERRLRAMEPVRQRA